MHSPGQNQITPANLCALAQRGQKTSCPALVMLRLSQSFVPFTVCHFIAFSHLLAPTGKVSYFGLYSTCKLAIFS